MKIYLTPPQPSRGLQRIADALVKHKPEWVEVVNEQVDAELVIIYAIGRCNQVTERAKYLEAMGRRYVVIQVCLRSTMNPSTYDWWHLWRWAKVVWSYYDLPRCIDDDGGDGNVFQRLGNFYHAPLGADAEVFQPRVNLNNERHYVVASSGLSRLSESVRECALAAAAVGRKVFHLGPMMPYGNVVSKTGLTDKELAFNYGGCEFVSALRRKEGFELPAVEGLLCGARPICFKGADWEHNYGHHAIYIEETDRQGVIDQLVQLFKHGAPPVSAEERQRAVERYNWETIIGGFYERLA